MTNTLLALLKSSFGFDPAESNHYFVEEIPRGGPWLPSSSNFGFRCAASPEP